jgi:hypothetical protein
VLCHTFFRLYLLSQEYVDLSTETLTAVSMSMGGGPVLVLQLAHTARPVEREAVRGAILTHAKEELARMGFRALHRLVPGGSTSSVAQPTAAEHLAAVLWGMDITMSGGEEACSQMTSIAEIQQAASAVRREVCIKPTARAYVFMMHRRNWTGQGHPRRRMHRLRVYVDYTDYALSVTM